MDFGEFEDVGLDMYTLGIKGCHKNRLGSLAKEETLSRTHWCNKLHSGDFPGGPVAKPQAPNAGGLGSIPGQGTRFHIPQLRVLML